MTMRKVSLVRLVLASLTGVVAVIGLLVLLPEYVDARPALQASEVDRFVFSSVGSTQPAGVGFTVVITAVDGEGATVISYTGSVTLSLTTGGTILPTETGAFSGGVRSETVTITQAADNVEIIAQDGLVTGTSNVFEVVASDLEYVVIQTASGVGGAEADTHEMTTDETWELYAAGYDAYDNYVGDVLVGWSVSGGVGSVFPTSAVSTTLDATTPGTGQVTASYSAAISDTTGSITVTEGAVAEVVIRTGPGEAGSEAGDYSMTTDETWELYAAGYDADGNYVGDVVVGWSVSGGIGSVFPTSAVSTTLDATTPGTGQVTASYSAAISDTTGVITVTEGDVSRVTIRTGPRERGVVAGAHDMTTDEAWELYAAGYDADGNYVGDVVVGWSVSGGIGSVFPTSAVSTTLDATTPGTGQVTASYSAAISDITGIITVKPGLLTSFEVAKVANPQTAGVGFTVVITGYDGEGNVKTDYVGPAVLTDTTGSIDPIAAETFSAGIWMTDTVIITKTVSGGTITVTDGAVEGSSNSFTIVPGPLHHIIISPTEKTILAGAQQEYTAAAFDRFGNPRGDITDETVFEIEDGAGGSWADNVYTSENYGDWTVRGEYTGNSRKESDKAVLTVLDTDLRFEKTDGRELVNAGDTLAYELTYGNDGNNDAVGIVITDTLPNYVQYVEDSCQTDTGTCRFEDGRVIFEDITIPGEGEGQASLKVRVLDPLPAGAQFIRNRASLTSPSSEFPFTVQDIDAIETRPDLTVAVTHAPSLFSPGRVMTFTVTYGNGGRMHAQGVVISATLPTGTTPTTRTLATWDSSDGVIYTYLVGGDGELLAGETGRSVLFAVRHPEQPEVAAPRFSSRFAITADAYTGGDADPGNSAVEHVVGVPDLTITGLEVDPWPLKPDVPVVFTITIKNRGTGWAWNPDNQGGFWADIFLEPVSSYPFERYSGRGIAVVSPPLAPGAEIELIAEEVYPWIDDLRGPILFSEEDVGEITTFYAKIDNFKEPTYGLVPEYNEENNVWPAQSNRAYLPLIARRQ